MSLLWQLLRASNLGHPETFIFKGWHKSKAAHGANAGWVCRCVPAAFNLSVCGTDSAGALARASRGLRSGVGDLPGSSPSYHMQHREIQPLVKPVMPRLICLDTGTMKICVFQVRNMSRHSPHSSV